MRRAPRGAPVSLGGLLFRNEKVFSQLSTRRALPARLAASLVLACVPLSVFAVHARADAPQPTVDHGIYVAEEATWSGEIGTFTGSDPSDAYSTSVDWGDGSSSPAVISLLGGTSYSVTASHTYAEDGTYTVTLTLIDTDGASSAATGTINVTEPTGGWSASLIVPANLGATLHPVVGVPLSTTTAVFYNSYTSETADDLEASIAWGDGTSSVGSISETNGQFTVVGSHTYTTSGEVEIVTSLVDADETGSATDFAGVGFSVLVMDADTGDLGFSRMPADMTVSATSAAGATVNYSWPLVHDDGSDFTPPGGPDIDTWYSGTCNPLPGATFPVGVTTVTCEVTDPDDTPSTATASFTVTVIDTDLTMSAIPPDVTTVATSGAGAVVTYAPPTATDEDGSVGVSCDHPSGSAFPVGTTTVTCTASNTDDTSSAVSGSFTVTVTDTDLTMSAMPPAVTTVATSAAGAVVTYTPPTATDEDGSVNVSCDHPSGTDFPIGTTTVTCTTSDSDDTPSTVSGNFTVTVADTDLLLSALPANISTSATSPQGSVVDYAAPTATDEDGAVQVVCDHPSGAEFPIGATTVTCTASDSDDTPSTVSGSFTVTIADTDLTLGPLPANITTYASSSQGAAVTYAPPPASDEDADASVVCDHPSGAAFAIGTTTVTCTASDSDDTPSSVTGTFDVTVQLHEAMGLDAFGGVCSSNGPTDSTRDLWSQPIARGIALAPGGTGGYTLDGYGDVIAFGGAPQARVLTRWSGWDIARGLVLLPDGSGGYVLDGFGGIHPFATGSNPMPPVFGNVAYWPHWDIARSVVLTASGRGGYVLDAFGGLHPFGDAPALRVTAYWRGWDIARSLTLNAASSGGYVLDAFGAVHPFGNAVPAGVTRYWSGRDVARAVVLLPGLGGRGYVLVQNGTVSSFGGAPPLPSLVSRGTSLFRALAIR